MQGWTVFANQALANAPMHDVIRKGGTVCAHFVAIKEEMVPLQGVCFPSSAPAVGHSPCFTGAIACQFDASRHILVSNMVSNF